MRELKNKRGKCMHSYSIKIKPRYAETDQMGVVYHGNYFPWFELGRDDFFHQLGCRYKTIEDFGIRMPVTHCDCQYIVSAKYDETIDVHTTLLFFNGVRLKLKFDVFREADQILLAKATIDYAFMNAESKPINLKKINKDTWQLFDDEYNVSAE